jgi:hypothetical protein
MLTAFDACRPFIVVVAKKDSISKRGRVPCGLSASMSELSLQGDPLIRSLEGQPAVCQAV